MAKREKDVCLMDIIIGHATDKTAFTPSKRKFGELMHGGLSDYEKKKIAARVLLAGGYECLND